MGKPSRIELIYSTFKQVLFEPPVRPGKRVDVEALSKHYGVSNIPIRMLLNRVAGEGIIEIVPHEGFAIPNATERRLRDVHRWNRQVLMLALETAMDNDPSVEWPPLSLEDDAVTATEMLFLAIAALDDNSEALRAVSNMNDRLRPIRRLDTAHLIDAAEELAAFATAWEEKDLYTLHRLVWQYHDRRLDLVPQLLALAYRE